MWGLSPGKDNFQWGLTGEGHLLSRVSAVGIKDQFWGEFMLLQHNIHRRCQWPRLLFPFCSAILSMSFYVHDWFMIGSWSQDSYFTPSLISVLWVGARRKPKGGKGSTYIRKATISQKCSTIFCLTGNCCHMTILDANNAEKCVLARHTTALTKIRDQRFFKEKKKIDTDISN